MMNRLDVGGVDLSLTDAGQELFHMMQMVDIAEAIADKGGRALYVGGWVRDRLMGLPSKDMDVEVFGMEPDALRTVLESFGTVNCVGESFGVYKLGDMDFTIPRRDSKTDRGHKGFVVTGDPTMSIEDAARRRDFTINAIYLDPLTLEYLDPFDGQVDIKKALLRVVDPERFADDSLRVLRGVQFAARFGFDFAPASLELMRGMDLSDLPCERVWGEFEKLLKSKNPAFGLFQAERLGVVDKLWPELASMKGVQQDPEWHPEGDVWEHTLQVVSMARQVVDAQQPSNSYPETVAVMLGALCHDMGKPSTTAFVDGRWRAHGHEAAGVPFATAFLDRLNVHTLDGYNVRAQVLALVEYHLLPLAWFKEQPRKSAFRRLSHKVDLLLLAQVAAADKLGRSVTGQPVVAPVEAVEWFVDTVGSLDLSDGPPPSLLMGRHLLDLGMKPGPQVGVVVKAVYERQMDGSVTNLDEALAAARELM